VRARLTFWAWAALAALLVAIGSGLIWSAYQRNVDAGVPATSSGDYGTILVGPSIFSSGEEFDPTLWYAAGTGLILGAAGSVAVAARLRARS
jgi:hypothetical protein